MSDNKIQNLCSQFKMTDFLASNQTIVVRAVVDIYTRITLLSEFITIKSFCICQYHEINVTIIILLEVYGVYLFEIPCLFRYIDVDRSL